MEHKINEFRKTAPPKSQQLTVYFEEYDSPYISCPQWISEMIEIAGGISINKELSRFKSASKRIVSDEFMIKKNPDVIIAAWCGKPFDKEKIKSRKGWSQIEAVKKDRIFTMPQDIVLQPSPRILECMAFIWKLLLKY